MPEIKPAKTPAAKNGKPAAPKKPRKKQAPQKPVIYAEFSVEMAVGENALTPDACKSLLGWEAETEEVKFTEGYLLKDRSGKRVRCLNNLGNRPLYMSTVERLVEDILCRRWRFNGEPIIIGKTGVVLNGQHQLVAVVLAEQDRNSTQSAHWRQFWQGEVFIDKVVHFGIDESDDVVNTMDTCKPRSLTDVIYRSQYFDTLKGNDRRMSSRVLDTTIHIMWDRSGAMASPFAKHQTHMASLDFLARHETLLKCVGHVMEHNVRIRDEEGKWDAPPIGQQVSVGCASAMMYLMASSASDANLYADKNGMASEKKLDWSRWDLAAQFWVDFANRDGATMANIVKALVNSRDPETGNSTIADKMEVFAKAWPYYVTSKTPGAPDLAPTQSVKGPPKRVGFGGIDRNDGTDIDDDGDDTIEPDQTDDDEPSAPKALTDKERQQLLAQQNARIENAKARKAEREAAAKKTAGESTGPAPRKNKIQEDQTRKAAEADAARAEEETARRAVEAPVEVQ